MVDADGKMRKEKTADSQKSKKNKTRNSDDKINKETKKKRKESFLSRPGVQAAVVWLGP